MSSPPASSFADEPRTPTSKQLDDGVPLYSTFNESSPLKNADRSIRCRWTIERSKEAQDKQIDLRFLENHLTSTPKDVWEGLLGDKRIEDIKKVTNDSAPIYGPLSHLLTEISENIHQNILPENERPDLHIIFLDHHHHRPTHHPYDVNDKPDILAVPGPFTNYEQVEGRSDYREVPHHKVVSLIECKPQREDGRAQAASYSFQLLEARPDMPGVYVLWAQPGGYQILWSDAAGIAASKFTSWDDLTPLAAYVHSLYRPPASHFLSDITITSPEGRLTSTNRVQWTVHADQPQPYTDCKSIFIGTPWGRRTNVWTHGHRRDRSLIVIKDSFVDNERRYLEDQLLDQVHRSGVYPGVVRLLKAVDFGMPITTAQPTTGSYRRMPQRTRKRLVLGSYGVPLREAKTVRDILIAIYDVVEIHRGLIKGPVDVLHRDISGYNILLYPFHHPKTEGALVQDPPLLIEQVLRGDKTGDGTDKATALLIDFDNGAKIVDPLQKPNSESTNVGAPNPEVAAELACRTGTPMFIARSVACGRFLYDDSVGRFRSMPILSPPAMQVYFAAYGEDTYNSYNDQDGQIHGTTLPPFNADETPIGQLKFCHRPDHDVESIYWVLLATLLRAQPQQRSENVGLTSYWAAYQLFLDHKIHCGTRIDCRDAMLRTPRDYFEDALDPRLHSLAQMLFDMARQIRPEYAYLNPPPVPDHLHEAMRRLLLEQILKMDEDPIPLEVGTLRPLKPREPPVPVPTPMTQPSVDNNKSSTKRKDTGEQTAQSSRSKRAKRGYDNDGSRTRYV